MVMTSLVNGIAQTCFSGRAKGKFLFVKVHLPFNRKTKGDLNSGQSLSLS